MVHLILRIPHITRPGKANRTMTVTGTATAPGIPGIAGTVTAVTGTATGKSHIRQQLQAENSYILYGFSFFGVF